MSHALLINEPPLQVLPSLAQIIGLNEAIVLQQIHYWLNPKHNKNVFNERHWVYNTYEQWKEQFPFWSLHTIRRTIYNLEKLKIIISFFQNDSERTKHYTIDYKALGEIQNASGVKNTPITLSKMDTVSGQNDHGQNPHKHSYFKNKSSKTRINTHLSNLDRDRVQNEQGPIYIDTENTTETNIIGASTVDTPQVVFRENSPDIEESNKNKRKKGNSLSEDWVLPVEWRNWSIERGMFDENIDKTEIMFKNYWLSTTKNAIKMNWFRTWQNWCLSECERKGIRLNVKKDPPPPIAHVAPVQPPIAKKIVSSNPKIQKWHDLQGKLSEKVGRNDYVSWLAELDLIEITDKQAVFKAKNKFIRDYISQRFRGDICLCLGNIDPRLSSEDSVKIITESSDGILM